jgi:tetratricopeptide (TPR) repeat protein
MEQAAAYIIANQSRFRDYLAIYRKQGLQLLEKYGPIAGEYPQSLANTWRLNFDEVRKISKATADLLYFSAFLSPDDIPIELIYGGAAHLGPNIKATINDSRDNPLVVDELFEPLTRYSLVRRDIISQTYSIHRLVQEVIIHSIGQDACRVWAERTIKAIIDVFPDPSEVAIWPSCERLVSQGKEAGLLAEKYDLESRGLSFLLTRVGRYLDKRGRYSEVEPLYQRSLAISEKVMGPEHPDVATILLDLALLYGKLGKYTEAEPLCQRSLAIKEKALGPEHPDVATILHNLANLYAAADKYTEAEVLYKRSLAIKEKVLGPEHPDLVATLNDLAIFYSSQGKYAEAEALYQRSLAIIDKELGKEHPDVTTILHDLAILCYRLGKYAEAEALYKRSLAIREKVLGPEHPDVATTLNDLAIFYTRQGKCAEAEALHQRSLAIIDKELGKEHPDSTRSLKSLPALLRETIRLYEATWLLEAFSKLTEEKG